MNKSDNYERCIHLPSECSSETVTLGRICNNTQTVAFKLMGQLVYL